MLCIYVCVCVQLATIFDHILAEDVRQEDKDWDTAMQPEIGTIRDSNLFLMPVLQEHIGLTCVGVPEWL